VVIFVDHGEKGHPAALPGSFCGVSDGWYGRTAPAEYFRAKIVPHVSHFLNDPHDYFQQELLVVGGRNSAVEYALRCWRAGAKVTLSYQ